MNGDGIPRAAGEPAKRIRDGKELRPLFHPWRLGETGGRCMMRAKELDMTSAAVTCPIRHAAGPELTQQGHSIMRHLQLLTVVLLSASVAFADDPPKAARPAANLPQGVTLIPNIEFARPEGHSLLLDLYLPDSASGPVPVIVWVHGGGWEAGDRHDRTALPILAHGYALASIDYRLSQVAKYPAQIEDCKAAIRWVRAHAKANGLDPNHIGVWGASAGGHLVALLGTTGDVKELEGSEGNLDVSSRVQAVCDWFGPTDFTVINQQAKKGPVPQVIQHDDPNSPEAHLLGGAIQENKAKARAADPITYVTKDDPPFLIMHGDHDALVPLAQSEILRDALQKAGVPVKLEVIKGAGHGFGGPKIMEQVAAFFDEYLKPREAAEKAGTATHKPEGAATGK
jgi:acetyl esterase/lipase